MPGKELPARCAEPPRPSGSLSGDTRDLNFRVSPLPFHCTYGSRAPKNFSDTLSPYTHTHTPYKHTCNLTAWHAEPYPTCPKPLRLTFNPWQLQARIPLPVQAIGLSLGVGGGQTSKPTCTNSRGCNRSTTGHLVWVPRVPMQPLCAPCPLLLLLTTRQLLYLLTAPGPGWAGRFACLMPTPPPVTNFPSAHTT